MSGDEEQYYRHTNGPRVGQVTAQKHAVEAEASAETFDYWASKYETQVLEWGYVGHCRVVDPLLQHIGASLGKQGKWVVLDAGSGTGLAGVELRRRVAEGCTLEILGVDHAALMLERCRQDHPGVYQSLATCSMGTAPLPFEDGSIDAVMCAGVFQPGGAAPESIIEIMRVLKPGGLAVYTVQLHWFAASSFWEIPRDMSGTRVEVSKEYTYEHEPEAAGCVVTVEKAQLVQGMVPDTPKHVGGSLYTVAEGGIPPFRNTAVRQVQKELAVVASFAVSDALSVKDLHVALGQLSRCKYPGTVYLEPESQTAAEALAAACMAFLAGETSLSLDHVRVVGKGTYADEALDLACRQVSSPIAKR
mmetsp:Transcript_23482/g.65936  ORF Transcript_23482/g.65936 Transcript_23482/m.65936 type:complete len:361 (-) Transcript_23482:201-1283(-)|eukprot:CAMPEP_0119126804 /NCGR_PEP_ID=MMETSP1310-20130426/5582_1 /TAXON_ID=464262 /ORGANISM="Genus nov. species nov., Strain RCC2339" /LENGTH=360 /DNA_ID=CAMNT_0007116991 /DNA_START=74 /DNA_END=1156 /DNA_ORIENTATION=-